MATKTETLVNEFKINYLTEDQYNEAVTNGEINENEIYMTPEENELQSSLNSHVANNSNPHGVTLSQLGITATAAELNKMDGITATTTEINYCDGVTSNIQTQLNNKSNTSHTHTVYPGITEYSLTNSIKIQSNGVFAKIFIIGSFTFGGEGYSVLCYIPDELIPFDGIDMISDNGVSFDFLEVDVNMETGETAWAIRYHTDSTATVNTSVVYPIKYISFNVPSSEVA